ncbi:Hypothetical predicted protein [Marmota monax]|uniref:Uncharacterized protein n=1 Tax=Marmota monax TaxID=9995 RepID=A0A5E4CES6_MARMO|nr:Hypothetical predicted protein [Marmota monax]
MSSHAPGLLRHELPRAGEEEVISPAPELSLPPGCRHHAGRLHSPGEQQATGTGGTALGSLNMGSPDSQRPDLKQTQATLAGWCSGSICRGGSGVVGPGGVPTIKEEEEPENINRAKGDRQGSSTADSTNSHREAAMCPASPDPRQNHDLLWLLRGLWLQLWGLWLQLLQARVLLCASLFLLQLWLLWGLQGGLWLLWGL